MTEYTCRDTGSSKTEVVRARITEKESDWLDKISEDFGMTKSELLVLGLIALMLLTKKGTPIDEIKQEQQQIIK